MTWRVFCRLLMGFATSVPEGSVELVCDYSAFTKVSPWMSLKVGLGDLPCAPKPRECGYNECLIIIF